MWKAMMDGQFLLSNYQQQLVEKKNFDFLFQLSPGPKR